MRRADTKDSWYGRKNQTGDGFAEVKTGVKGRIACGPPFFQPIGNRLTWGDVLVNGSIRVRFSDGSEQQYAAGTTLMEIAADRQSCHASPIVAASVNNALTDLQSRQETEAEIDFFDLSTGKGVKVYERSQTFVLIIAAERLFPGKDIVVEHSFGSGVYFEWLLDREVTEADIRALEQEMERIVEENLPLVRRNLPLAEAIRQLEALGDFRKVRLLRQIERDTVNLYECDGQLNYFYGPMVPETGFLKRFELRFYPPGFILRFPVDQSPNHSALCRSTQIGANFAGSRALGRTSGLSDGFRVE